MFQKTKRIDHAPGDASSFGTRNTVTRVFVHGETPAEPEPGLEIRTSKGSKLKIHEPESAPIPGANRMSAAPGVQTNTMAEAVPGIGIVRTGRKDHTGGPFIPAKDAPPNQFGTKMVVHPPPAPVPPGTPNAFGTVVSLHEGAPAPEGEAAVTDEEKKAEQAAILAEAGEAHAQVKEVLAKREELRQRRLALRRRLNEGGVTMDELKSLPADELEAAMKEEESPPP